jgi:hypothetical protein
MAFFKKKVVEDVETGVIQPQPRNVETVQQPKAEPDKETIELSGDEILLLNDHRERKALKYKELQLLQEIKDILDEINKKA